MSEVVRSFHLIASSSMGGAETSFERHTMGLQRAGHSVVAGLRKNSQLAELMGGSLPINLFGMRSNFDFRSTLQIRRAARDIEADVVQTWASRATWLTHNVTPAVHIARLGGYYKPRYFRHADAWIVNTLGLRSWMIRHGFPKDRVEWVPNFVPECSASAQPVSRAQMGIPEDAFLLLGTGRFIAKKGFADLISAFERLKPEILGRPVHLLLIGDGECLRDLQLRARGAFSRIHFSGWLKNPLPQFELADIFVCPSREEPLGNVVLEAWSQSLPVICTRTMGGCELIENDRTGILVDTECPQSLARAISDLLSDQDRRGMLASEGNRYLRSNFSEQRSINSTLDFYRKIQALGAFGQ